MEKKLEVTSVVSQAVNFLAVLSMILAFVGDVQSSQEVAEKIEQVPQVAEQVKVVAEQAQNVSNQLVVLVSGVVAAITKPFVRIGVLFGR